MIRLDFARPISRSLQVLRWGLLMSGLLATAGVFLWTNALQDQLQAHEWKRGHIAATAPRTLNTALPDDASGAGQTSQQRAILRELGVDWRSVFAAIEKSVTPDIRIMAIRPDPQRQSLTIQARAANGAQAQRFVERLQAGGVIRDAHLVHEERDGEDELLDFSVRAHWERVR